MSCPTYGHCMVFGQWTEPCCGRKKSGRGALGIDLQTIQKDLASVVPAVKPSVHHLRVTCPEEAEASKQMCKEEKLLYIPKQTINRGPYCSQKEEMNNSSFPSLCDLCLVIRARWKKMEILKEASLDENISANLLPLATLEMNYNCKMCIFVAHSLPSLKII